MGVKGGLNHKTRQDIFKITRRHYHLQKIRCSIHEYKFIFLKENIKNHCLLFCYNIRAYLILGIGYVAVRRIPCSRSLCLIKLAYKCNRIQDIYNKY